MAVQPHLHTDAVTPTNRLILAWALGIFAGMIVAVAIGGLIGPVVGAFVAIGVKTLLVRVFEQRG